MSLERTVLGARDEDLNVRGTLLNRTVPLCRQDSMVWASIYQGILDPMTAKSTGSTR